MTVCDVCGYPMTAVFFSTAFVCNNCDNIHDPYQSSATGPRVESENSRGRTCASTTGSSVPDEKGKRA